jgi:hypothetical protein
MRAAMERWGQHIAQLANGDPAGVVVHIRKASA